MENRKVFLNKHTNLLELEEHMYPLVDVDTPNVFRNLFRYDEIPKIAFNDRIVPHNMPDEIWITDTTFRDGQQSRAPYTTEQIVKIYDYLHRLGGPNGKIRQSEFFLYSKKDRDAVYKCMERGYRFPEVTSWIRASKKDFELVKDIGLKETGILVSCSDYHIFYKMKMTRREAMEHYLSVIRDCLDVFTLVEGVGCQDVRVEDTAIRGCTAGALASFSQSLRVSFVGCAVENCGFGAVNGVDWTASGGAVFLDCTGLEASA